LLTVETSFVVSNLHCSLGFLQRKPMLLYLGALGFCFPVCVCPWVSALSHVSRGTREMLIFFLLGLHLRTLSCNCRIWLCLSPSSRTWHLFCEKRPPLCCGCGSPDAQKVEGAGFPFSACTKPWSSLSLNGMLRKALGWAECRRKPPASVSAAAWLGPSCGVSEAKKPWHLRYND
jgi:hypothetical protein